MNLASALVLLLQSTFASDSSQFDLEIYFRVILGAKYMGHHLNVHVAYFPYLLTIHKNKTYLQYSRQQEASNEK